MPHFAREVLRKLLAIVEFSMVSINLDEWHDVFANATHQNNLLFQLRASIISIGSENCIWYSMQKYEKT